MNIIVGNNNEGKSTILQVINLALPGMYEGKRLNFGEGIIRNFRLNIEPQIYDIDTFVIQKIINNLIEQDYSNNTVKKNKHLISQFFEYAIDNKWVSVNPTSKVQVRTKDKAQSKKDKYKALPPEVRIEFLEALNKDETNFIKPLCIYLLFSGLRICEALALHFIPPPNPIL